MRPTFQQWLEARRNIPQIGRGYPSQERTIVITFPDEALAAKFAAYNQKHSIHADQDGTKVMVATDNATIIDGIKNLARKRGLPVNID